MMITTACIAPGNPSSVQLLCVELQDSTSAVSETKPALAKYTWYNLTFKCPVETVNPPVESIRDSIEGIATVTSFDSKSLPLYTAFQSHPSNGAHYLLFMSENIPNLPNSKQTPDKPAAESIVDSTTHNEDTPPADTEEHFGLGYASQGYEWSQTDSEVVVRFELPSGVTKKEVRCVISRQELMVGLSDGTTFFRGEVHDAVDTEASTWTIEKDV